MPTLRSLATLACGLAAVAQLHAQSAKLVSIEIKSALPPGAKEIAFGQFPDSGMEVEAGFLISAGPGVSIVDIDEKKCRIKSVVDATSGQVSATKIEFGNFPRIDKKSGNLAFHSISFASPAAAGAGRLKVAGTVNATTAKGVNTVKIDKTTLANGSIIKAGELSLKVSGLMAGDDKLKFTLGSGKPMTGIKEIRFLDAAGQALEADRQGSSRMSMMGSFTETWDYEVTAKSKDMALEVDLFKDTETKEIPFEFTVPAGM